MSYLVLARKYRPVSFDEVIGQEHITDLLKSAIQSSRIAHAYLFCGPRGVGKTSCARILAKCLNCAKGPIIKPCDQCTACVEITKGNSFDVLEIDGASNRGIDEIRALRENVKFAPGYGRYKVYIIDEVHQITTDGFNALLKTLEEPPEHVKFIFATTDINKVPETIISRCQRFDFKRVSLKTVTEALEKICKQEKLTIDAEALMAIAKSGQGSVRDSLSILDQLSSINAKQIKASDVSTMLGTVETQWLFDLVDMIGKKDCPGALQILDKIIEQGKDVRQLSKDLLEHFRNLMIVKVGGKTLGKLIDYPISIKDMLLVQSEKFTLTDILKAIDLLIETQDVARITETLRMPLEIAFAKLTHTSSATAAVVKQAGAGNISSQPSASTMPLRPEPVKEIRKPSAMEVLKNERGQVSISSVENEPTQPDAPMTEPLMEEVTSDLTVDKIKKVWDALTFAVSREKMSVATYLQEGIPIQLEQSQGSGRLTIGFSKDHGFQKESLESRDSLQVVERVFGEKLKIKLRIQYKLVDNFSPKEDEPLIQSALDTFNGKVVHKWHKE